MEKIKAMFQTTNQFMYIYVTTATTIRQTWVEEQILPS
jgi:hypothetical protein